VVLWFCVLRSAPLPSLPARDARSFLPGTRSSNFGLGDCRVQSETDNRPLRIQRRQPHQSHIAGQFEWPTQPTTPITATSVSFPLAAVSVVADAFRLPPRRHGAPADQPPPSATLPSSRGTKAWSSRTLPLVARASGVFLAWVVTRAAAARRSAGSAVLGPHSLVRCLFSPPPQARWSPLGTRAPDVENDLRATGLPELVVQRHPSSEC